MFNATARECRVVAHFADGRVLKGTIRDFSPDKPLCHLVPEEPGEAALKIQLGTLKALFFVKDYSGDSQRRDRVDFDDAPAQGRRLIVHFKDGEAVAGTTSAFAPDKPGFFISPTDPAANNERIFILRSAVKRVEWVQNVPAATS